MRILITGIAGFAGSYLAEEILKRGDEVFGICLACESLENIQKIRKNLRISRGDVTNFEQIFRLVKRINPDQIYHLAALSSVGESFSHPKETIENNIRGTLYFLEIIRKLEKPIKILVAGSSDMYGIVKPKEIPITEERSLLPVSPYGVSKAAGDLLAYQYFKSYGVCAIRARAFNHTGPRQRPGFVIPDFASQIARMERGLSSPVLRVGNLSTKRDISDVRDVVRAYVSLMARGKPGEAYNICSHRAYGVEEMLNILLGLSKKKIRVKVEEKRDRPAEIPILLGSSSKIRKATGWKPEIPIEKTLEDTLNFWRAKSITSD
ncbi:MAG: GDP-mannose 4,6-dehydratase [Candidatus Zixiibacteriota bacterium]